MSDAVDYAEDYLIYWSSLIGYILTIWGAMEYAYSKEIKPLPDSFLIGNRIVSFPKSFLRQVLMLGLKYSILPTLSPVIIWSMLSYLIPTLHDFLMGFWGGLSLLGVYCINLIFSYSDDFFLNANFKLCYWDSEEEF